MNPFDTRPSAYDETTYTDTALANSQLASEFVNAGIKMKGDVVAAKESAQAWKERMKYQAGLADTGGGILGGIGSALGAVSSVAGLFCERRLKQQIQPLDDRCAWSVVRDLPLYQFEYRHRPGLTVYGPMVDEVEALDPSLVVPMDLEAQALGIHDGQPVRGLDAGRQRAYESLALQQALRRIEALESRLLQLEAALHPELVIGDGAPAAVPCWGGRDELPLVFGA